MIQFVGLCAVGAESILSNELKLLHFKPLTKLHGSTLPGRVFFTSVEKEPAALSMLRANFYLRTADRIYLALHTFYADNFDALFNTIVSLDWQQFFQKDAKIIVDKVRTFKSILSSEHAIQKAVHKAIYSSLCKVWHMHVLPETGKQYTVRIYIEHNQVHVLLDLSGEPLHRRGYRLSGGTAPMRETLAAVLLQCLYWKRKLPLHDAFCGSGTIPIEAAWFAYNIPPGINRRFAFEDFACFQSKDMLQLFEQERRKGILAIRTDCLVRVSGSDNDGKAVSLAQKNAERACMIAGRALQRVGKDNRIPRPDFIKADVTELTAPYPEGVLLSNPPYGERLGSEQEAAALYEQMTGLPREFEKWRMGFITDKPIFAEIFEQKGITLKKRPLKSGNLDTCLYSVENTLPH
ncbi:MAG: THUMP domain-containing class I SAM-dependent RNA methyltransferase [Treponema sp.]